MSKADRSERCSGKKSFRNLLLMAGRSICSFDSKDIFTLVIGTLGVFAVLNTLFGSPSLVAHMVAVGEIHEIESPSPTPYILLFCSFISVALFIISRKIKREPDMFRHRLARP